MKRSTEVSRGYVVSGVAAGGFLATLIPDLIDIFDTVSGYAVSGLLCCVSAVMGTIATRLLRPPRPVPLLFILVFVAAAAATGLGAILNIQDYLSESGFNDIGAGILFSAGLALSFVSALLSTGLALVCRAKERRNPLEE